MKQIQTTECLGCGFEGAIITFNEKYRGLRGSCPRCGSNWPES